MLRTVGASDAVAALLARDPAAHANLSDPQAVAELLNALRYIGASEAVAALLTRDPAAHANLSDPQTISHLLNALLNAGASDAANVLAARAAAHADLSQPGRVTLKWDLAPIS